MMMQCIWSERKIHRLWPCCLYGIGKFFLSISCSVADSLFIDANLCINAAEGKSFTDEADAIELFVEGCGCLLFYAGKFVL